ncbi:DEBR0S3_07932g1_1 [Brettanomyces bruxellensis]|uniref:Cytochrome c oxidase subunit 8, mitochondrial n=1 Tax=Dekkera bruxellensis TaxID=5007 RepID=A0A7D9CZA0_DEKBR|nr:DEBR0S3_07932g1_1 [Brettanomyces bruxellensis]
MFGRLMQFETKRFMSSSAIRATPHYHFKDGIYSNIPFKVHNRRVPYAVPHIIFFSLGFIIPCIALFVQFRRNGDFQNFHKVFGKKDETAEEEE